MPALTPPTPPPPPIPTPPLLQGLAYYEDALSRAIEAVHAARTSVDKTLRSSSSHRRPAVAAALKALDARLASLLAGLSAPPHAPRPRAASAFVSRGAGLAHRVKVWAGLEQPTMHESLAALLASGHGNGGGFFSAAGRGSEPSFWARLTA